MPPAMGALGLLTVVALPVAVTAPVTLTLAMSPSFWPATAPA